MKKYFKQQINAMVKAYKSYDEKMTDRLLSDCLKTIKEKRSIIATALGKNVPICEKFIGTLNSVSINAHFMHANSAIHGDLGLVKKGDVVIILSKSGETEETIVLSLLLTKRKSKNWLLTCSKNSTTEKIVKNAVIFNLIDEGDPWNIIPNNSTLIFLMFLQALAMAIIEELKIPLKVFKANHPGGAIGKILKKR